LIALIINAHPSGTVIDFEFSLFISTSTLADGRRR
jgi:hypothetical protein